MDYVRLQGIFGANYFKVYSTYSSTEAVAQ